MAEAILEKVGKGRFRAYSAGSDPAPEPMPEVHGEAPQTLGHDVSGPACKSWDEFMRPDAPRMDFVIALCDMPHGQACPDIGSTRRDRARGRFRTRPSSRAARPRARCC